MQQFLLQIHTVLSFITVINPQYCWVNKPHRQVYAIYIIYFCYCPKHCFRLIEGQQSAGLTPILSPFPNCPGSESLLKKIVPDQRLSPFYQNMV